MYPVAIDIGLHAKEFEIRAIDAFMQDVNLHSRTCNKLAWGDGPTRDKLMHFLYITVS